ncbi:MAG: amidohydrolase family protein [Candidatus Bipolaricaulis sp.]|nr:amidohydrolase family protein [Candidatus Bipolaricaulis sp.]MDY0391856.1 amidohydrolase family protein [Candidatus Bipolaricaulis sp.]
MAEFAITGGTVVTPRRVGEADVLVRNGKVARIGRSSGKGGVVPATGLLVLPGAIDAHVHLALPVAGTRSADDFASGTRAAAAGGVTTVLDFTVGEPGVPLPDQIERRLTQAREAVVDFALRAEMVGWTPDRRGELGPAAELGVRSFKFFLAYAASGRRTPLGVLHDAMVEVRKVGGVAMVHAEAEELVDPPGGPFPRARPPLAEEVAIAEVGILARDAGCPTYIAHVSTARGLVALQAAQRAGAPLVGETCPHYLLLDERAYGQPDGHRFSVTPPLRTVADRDALWRALARRRLQAVSTDHCPFTNAQKDPFRDDPARLPSGLPGVETLLPLLYSEGVARGRITLRDLAWYLGEGPARAFGLWPRKGGIRVGADADLVLVDPHRSWTIEAEKLHMATDFSPYEGITLTGRVVAVLSRGEWLVRDGELLAQSGRGEFIPWR